MVGSLVFLTPAAGLVACAVLVPLAALAVALRRERRGRELLQLPAPPRTSRLRRVLALAAVPALLGLAATQPALRSQQSAHVRTDAQAIYVLDVSRSMLAAGGPTATDRLTRAKRDAVAMRAALAEVPSGVATFTDRVLPNLLPDDDPAVFDATVAQAVMIEQPPPASGNVVATTLGALGALGTQNFFPPTATRRLVVLLTDGESRAYDPQLVARELASGPGIHLILVHVAAPGEAVYTQGQREQGYREDPTSGQSLAALAAASGGAVFDEHSLGAAVASARLALGSGPTQVRGQTERSQTLAPYVALLALLPLLAVVGLPGAGRGRLRALRALAARPGAAPSRSAGGAEPVGAAATPQG